MRTTLSSKELFLDKVSSEPMSGCWLWTGYCNKKGYGSLGRKGKQSLAHRFSYELYRGPIPSKLHVLHKCDNPPCVNPDHLFLGTQKDNMADMISKGRDRKNSPRGERHNSARLNNDQVRVIYRLAHLETLTFTEIGRTFAVTRHSVRRIKNGRLWAHITGHNAEKQVNI